MAAEQPDLYAPPTSHANHLLTGIAEMCERVKILSSLELGLDIIPSVVRKPALTLHHHDPYLFYSACGNKKVTVVREALFCLLR